VLALYVAVVDFKFCFSSLVFAKSRLRFSDKVFRISSTVFGVSNGAAGIEALDFGVSFASTL
jgi:hypothetical protein